MVVVATQTHLYRGGDGGSRCGDGDGVETWWRWMRWQRGCGGGGGGVMMLVMAVSVGDDRGADVGGSEVVVWRQWLCGIHDDGGVVEMRMCGGSVVGSDVGWRGGGWWCRRLVAEKWLEKG
ncbi:hypothetical protein Tco_1231671 [Tanacetum coccineum]